MVMARKGSLIRTYGPIFGRSCSATSSRDWSECLICCGRACRSWPVHHVGENGLALFPERSAEFKRVFGKAPSSILDGRPVTDLQLLDFLRSREHVLFLTATRDVQDRSLVAKKREAVATLGNHIGRATRSMACELLHRSLYLYFWVEKHGRIGAVESLDTLARRACEILQDVSLDDETLERCGCSEAALAAKGWSRPDTWLALVTLLEVEDG